MNNEARNRTSEIDSREIARVVSIARQARSEYLATLIRNLFHGIYTPRRSAQRTAKRTPTWPGMPSLRFRFSTTGAPDGLFNSH